MENNEINQMDGADRPSRAANLVVLVLVLFSLPIFIFCLWQGRWLALLTWLLTLWLVGDASVRVLFALYNEPLARRMGCRYWLASVFMGQRGTQIVTPDGKIIAYRPFGPMGSLFARLGGPGIVIVENGAAVVMERGGRFTRVKGSGIVFTTRFERVAKVVDLRRQVRSRPVRNVMTRDGLSFDIDNMDVLFDLAADFDPRQGEYRYSEEAMHNLVFRGGLLYQKGAEVEWGDRVAGIVEYHLRNAAAAYALAYFVKGDNEHDNPRTRFLQEVESRARPALQQIGVRLVGIDMGRLVVPEEMHAVLVLDLRQEAIERTSKVLSEGLSKAIDRINLAMAEDHSEARPHLLLNLTESLGRLLEESRRLSGLPRQEPRPLLGSGEPGEED